MPHLFRLLPLLLLLASSSQAIVYTLNPGGGSQVKLEDALQGDEVLTRELRVNGHRGELTVSALDLPWSQLLDRLEPLLDRDLAREGPTSLVIESERDDQRFTRYLLVQTKPGNTIVVFRLELPVAALVDGRIPWPELLPKPVGATLGSVMHLDKHTVYATFSSSAHPTAVLRGYDSRLQQAGWQRLDDQPDGGAVYQDAKGQRLLVLSLFRQRGITQAALYVSPPKR